MGSSYDYFTDHPQIHEIRDGEFCQFISDKDIVMVMFYAPAGEASKFLKDHYADAPALTDRPNAVYAAVNCDAQKSICFKEKAFEPPEFKAYSRGKMVANYDFIISMTGQKMAKFVEDLPIPVSSSTPAPSRKKY